MNSKSLRLFAHIGEIDDTILEEAESANIVADTANTRKRYVRYGTVAAAASFGVAVTFLLIRSRRLSARTA